LNSAKKNLGESQEDLKNPKYIHKHKFQGNPREIPEKSQENPMKIHI
jgi:hypothetical protein